MSDEQWESLCDGCGRCCLQKLEDEDTQQVVYTRVSCKLLDTETCLCRDYPNRLALVPDCLTLRPLADRKLNWLPKTCAYRKLALGKPLENWHPLISGTSESVRTAGISVENQCISEEYVPVSELFRYVINDSGELDG